MYITVGAKEFLTDEESQDIIKRFLKRDWGDTHEDDKLMNDEALQTGDRILAKYIVRDTPIFIITDAGHEVTTILLANEY